MIREYDPACEALIKLGGCKVLQEVLKKPETTARTKAVFLIRYLCQHYTEAKGKVSIFTIYIGLLIPFSLPQGVMVKIVN